MSNHEIRPSGLSEFKFDREDLNVDHKRPPIDLVKDSKGLEKQFKMHGRSGFKVEGIPGIVAVPINLMEEITLNPQRHTGSDAEYYLDGVLMPDGSAIFLYTLAEGRTTSKHHHKKPLTEDNFVLYGKVDISGIEVEDHYHSPSHTDHQVTAIGERVLFVAKLNNAALLPREEWHIPRV